MSIILDKRKGNRMADYRAFLDTDFLTMTTDDMIEYIESCPNMLTPSMTFVDGTWLIQDSGDSGTHSRFHDALKAWLIDEQRFVKENWDDLA